jgi:hypothetical protein
MPLPDFPTPMPQVHVVVDHFVRHLHHHSAWATFVDWSGTNWATIALGLATLFLGVAALATIVANDVGQQERLLPLCDLADVKPVINSDNFDYDEVVFYFDLLNDGGGPAKGIRLTLVQYGDDKPGIENYLGSISPGQRRPSKQPFKLPKSAAGYTNTEPFVLLLTYQWMRPGIGEAYICDRFPDNARPPDERPRTTQPRVVPRGPALLLWWMKRIGMDYS